MAPATGIVCAPRDLGVCGVHGKVAVHAVSSTVVRRSAGGGADRTDARFPPYRRLLTGLQATQLSHSRCALDREHYRERSRYGNPTSVLTKLIPGAEPLMRTACFYETTRSPLALAAPV